MAVIMLNIEQVYHARNATQLKFIGATQDATLYPFKILIHYISVFRGERKGPHRDAGRIFPKKPLKLSY
jgi:hypothetical protein